MDNNVCQEPPISKASHLRRSLQYKAVFIWDKAVVINYVRPRDLSAHQVIVMDTNLKR